MVPAYDQNQRQTYNIFHIVEVAYIPKLFPILLTEFDD